MIYKANIYQISRLQEALVHQSRLTLALGFASVDRFLHFGVYRH